MKWLVGEVVLAVVDYAGSSTRPQGVEFGCRFGDGLSSASESDRLDEC